MLEAIIVFLIIGAAAGYMILSLYRGFKGQASCGCDCRGCSDTPDCDKSSAKRGHAVKGFTNEITTDRPEISDCTLLFRVDFPVKITEHGIRAGSDHFT